MAKKIRFPLEMENGVEVRSMEELRDNFSLAKVLEYFENGKLVTWLRDRYANDVADAVEALEKNEPELAKKLSGIFDVPYDEKAEEKLKEAEERAERLKRLKKFTDDEQFWDKVDYVAFEQDELYDLLDEGAETIYLCGDRFSIPLSKPGVRYIGVNNPTAVIDSKAVVDWDDKKISIEGVTFDEKYQRISEQDKSKTIFGSWVEKAAKAVDEDGNVDRTEISNCSRAIYAKLSNSIGLSEGDTRFSEVFEKMTTADIKKFADWVADRIYDGNTQVLDIAGNGTFTEQAVKLAGLYGFVLSHTDKASNDNSGMSFDDWDGNEDTFEGFFEAFMANAEKKSEQKIAELKSSGRWSSGGGVLGG